MAKSQIDTVEYATSRAPPLPDADEQLVADTFSNEAFARVMLMAPPPNPSKVETVPGGEKASQESKVRFEAETCPRHGSGSTLIARGAPRESHVSQSKHVVCRAETSSGVYR